MSDSESEEEYLDDEIVEWTEKHIQSVPADGAFTPLTMSTCVLATKVKAPSCPHKNLVDVFRKNGLDGSVIAMNSNFGGVCQPGYESFLKAGAKSQPMAPVGRKQRQPEGVGGCINSSMEILVLPMEKSEIARVIKDSGKPLRPYNVKLFPTTGAIQVPGCVLFDMKDGLWALRACVDYLNRKNIMGGDVVLPPHNPQNPMDGYWFDMVNFKFRLNKRTERQVLDFAAFAEAALDASVGWPAEAQESLICRKKNSFNFKFMHPIKHKITHPRVNLFVESGKINLLGCPSIEFGQEIYRIVNQLVSENWDRFVVLKPIPDEDRETPVKEIISVLDGLATKKLPPQVSVDDFTEHELSILEEFF